MRREREIELLERVRAAGPRLQGLHASASMVNPASAYTDAERFSRERRLLFRRGPVFFGLGREIESPGAYRAARLDGVPVLVVRQEDGSLRAMVNACRHRGAPLVDPNSSGIELKAIHCPYHAWAYDLAGKLKAQPLSSGSFDDVEVKGGLHPLAVEERYGMIFVRAGGTEPIGVDAFLAGAEDDLGAFGLEHYVPVESRTRTWNMNWKLVLDTFTESYHIRTLHRNSIAPGFNSDCVISESFGPHTVSIGLRKGIFDELKKPQADWALLPYATLNYLVFPNALIVHQIDHIEIWRIEPVDVRTTIATTTVFAPAKPDTEKARRYFIKNLDLLLQVTGAEDFPLMEQIQANLDSGALPEVVYGRNEPPLIDFHRAVNDALGLTI